MTLRILLSRIKVQTFGEAKNGVNLRLTRLVFINNGLSLNSLKLKMLSHIK